MPKHIHRLTALKVKKLAKPGWYPDGQGLYLQVSPSLSKSWVYRYQLHQKEKRHGLGGYPAVNLEAARQAAEQCRQLRNQGIDPITHKQAQLTEQRLQQAKGQTFKQCAAAYIDAHKAGWKNAKHAQQWQNTLQTYAYPIIGDLVVQAIDTGLVMQVLEPIWYRKTETASRVRQRIESILDWAKVRNYRTGENPALWRGHLDKLLPKRTKVQKVVHFPAMPYQALPDYFRALREQTTLPAYTLAFIILNVTRSSETRLAIWSEFDLEAGIWTIPAERMKANRPHRIPLSTASIAILHTIAAFRVDNHVFPGLSLSKGKPISDMLILNHLKQTHPTLTVHGFRSTFRDWCAEMTHFPGELAEAALAHRIKDATQAAYERGDKFEKRRQLMDAWMHYCLHGQRAAEVVHLPNAQAQS